MASRMESKSQHLGTVNMNSELAAELEKRYPGQLRFVEGKPSRIKMKGKRIPDTIACLSRPFFASLQDMHYLSCNYLHTIWYCWVRWLSELSQSQFH